MSEPRLKRATLRYEGRVQGVGFRYTTLQLARQLAVAGTVQNCADGSVKVVAEGPEEALDRLVLEIRSSHLGRFIRAESRQDSCATGEFEDFDVRYGPG